ncbi:MAG: (5-formylfuran-3-yl)methyl phosphate synthase [Rhodocyclaceae bacterium]|nr:(5-formylfuran-3-yl)methyl phosphate synthase [Rhodocyclaceae bacterium]
MRILVSVRNSDEAAIAASAGVDFIDLKEPAAGALGGLPGEQIRAIVASLAERGAGIRISATIGDLPVEAEAEIVARVRVVAACGVNLVKVGLPGQGGRAALRVAERLAGLGVPLVPVLIADRGLAPDFVAAIAGLPFAAVMLDTQVKTGGSLLDLLPEPVLQGFLASARGAGRSAGLAGALRQADLPALRRLDPDFAGFRSAVCDGPRASALSADCLERLLVELRPLEVG